MHIFDDYKSAEKFLKTLFRNNSGPKNATWCIIPAGESEKNLVIFLNSMSILMG